MKVNIIETLMGPLDESSDKLEVLIAEDSKFVALQIKKIFENFTIEYMTNWVTRLKDLKVSLSEKNYDLLLLDLFLSDGNSLEEIEKIKHLYPDLTIVIMSAQSDIRIAFESMDKGADYYLVKDDRFPSDLFNILKLLNRRIRNEITLKKIVDEVFNPSLYPSSLMKVSNEGSTILLNDFIKFPEDVGNFDAFIQNVSIRVLFSLGHDQLYHTGFYRFPAGESRFYTLFNYAFRLKDENSLDERLKVGFFHYMIFVPISFVNLMPSLELLNSLVPKITDLFSDASEINKDSISFLKKEIFKNIREQKVYHNI